MTKIKLARAGVNLAASLMLPGIPGTIVVGWVFTGSDKTTVTKAPPHGHRKKVNLERALSRHSLLTIGTYVGSCPTLCSEIAVRDACLCEPVSGL